MYIYLAYLTEIRRKAFKLCNFKLYFEIFIVIDPAAF